MTCFQISIQLAELEASKFVFPETFDNNGNPTGLVSDEKFREMLSNAAGKTKFKLEITCDGKRAAFQSPDIGSNDCETRKHAIETLFRMAGLSFYHNFLKEKE